MRQYATLAIGNYRLLLNLTMPLGRLSVITGPNGSGKSNIYRALRRLAETAQSGIVAALSRRAFRWHAEVPSMGSGALNARAPIANGFERAENSLHPDLLPPLARLIIHASSFTQIWVVSHSRGLIAALIQDPGCRRIALEKELGETSIAGQGVLDEPAWNWLD